jgi:hypothetical protein
MQIPPSQTARVLLRFPYEAELPLHRIGSQWALWPFTRAFSLSVALAGMLLHFLPSALALVLRSLLWRLTASGSTLWHLGQRSKTR